MRYKFNEKVSVLFICSNYYSKNTIHLKFFGSSQGCALFNIYDTIFFYYPLRGKGSRVKLLIVLILV